MIEQLHSHLLKDMEQAAKGDTIFVLCSVLFNLLVLGINSAVALNDSLAAGAVFFVFFCGSVLVTVAAVFSLVRAIGSSKLYYQTLLNIYKDQGVAHYWPTQLQSNAHVRLYLYMLIVLVTGTIAIIVPWVVGNA